LKANGFQTGKDHLLEEFAEASADANWQTTSGGKTVGAAEYRLGTTAAKMGKKKPLGEGRSRN